MGLIKMKKCDVVLLSDNAAIIVDTTYWGIRSPFVWVSSIRKSGENLTGFGVDLSDIIPGLNEVFNKLGENPAAIHNFDVKVVRTNYRFTVCTTGPIDNRRLCLNLGEGNGKPCIVNVPSDNPALFISSIKNLLNYLEKLNNISGPEYDLSKIEDFDVIAKRECSNNWFVLPMYSFFGGRFINTIFSVSYRVTGSFVSCTIRNSKTSYSIYFNFTHLKKITEFVLSELEKDEDESVTELKLDDKEKIILTKKYVNDEASILNLVSIAPGECWVLPWQTTSECKTLLIDILEKINSFR